ncbi:protein crumbs homolog 1 [Lingula anatina]|uniref:Protein crumbs homolog 1 n=1 Tax=Lingula anatina TaxID=7574 RepID=A0A1S3JLP7_LINAN|nr:protein crumbs homolog 1 [Lingula anatina]|eukprot:XP_013411335.1 protein crumbs homolog 1 [Lingula anatina]
MVDKNDITAITASKKQQNSPHVNVAYRPGTSSDVDLAEGDTPNVYESLMISHPAENTTDPHRKSIKPLKTKVKKGLLITLIGILCVALVITLSIVFAREGYCDKLTQHLDHLISAENGLKARDPCRSQPCQNGAECKNQSETYLCSCPSGYTGRNCETVTNHCLSLPCKNGASCESLMGSVRCSCTSDFRGPRCEDDINECLNNPCAKGATCRNNYGGFHCSCPPGFTGTFCQLEISECSSRPCQNGGTCVDMVNSYQCLCSAGYYESNCQTRNPCRSQPCQNGAECKNQSETYLCSCPSGYTGRNCETESCSTLSYEVLDQAWRSLNFTVVDGEEHCDKVGWVTQWYRFSGAAGIKMPNWCVPTHHCGTHAPVWINGSNPVPEDFAVDRQACANWGSDCCNWSLDVKVRNCVDYFLYYLPPITKCHLAYCGEG